MKILLSISILSIAVGCTKNTETASVVPTSTPSSLGNAFAKTYDGPFGLAQGISLKELETSLDFNQYAPRSYFYTGTPPKLLEGVSRYVVIATPNQGVCKVIAQFSLENINGAGTQLKEKVENIKDLLVLKYGDYTSKYDFVTEDSYRKNPNYWTMALLKESANYSYAWESKKKEKKLPSNLKSVDISAHAKSISNGTVDIQYEFNNFLLCQKEMKEAKASNL